MERGAEQALDCGRRRMLRELGDIDGLQRQCRIDILDEAARGLGRLGDEVATPAGDFQGAARNDRIDGNEAERAGDYEKPAFRGRRHQLTLKMDTPSARNMSVRRIRGKPMSAVGSSLAIRVNRAIPAASTRTAPAQS